KSIEEMTSMLKVGPADNPIDFGAFIAAIINFIIMAFIIFLIVKGFNKLASLKKKEEIEEAPTTKVCPFCCSEIDIKATRCPHCTSELDKK
ncbi:MAG: MscL family protein, partial [Ruminococcus sp.]|nr:MscL family protein [Ruminococcus sp.]